MHMIFVVDEDLNSITVKYFVMSVKKYMHSNQVVVVPSH